MYDIGLVIHLKNNSGDKLEIDKALHVIYHGGFENQNLSVICDPSNQVYE